jgi:uncharacterized protein YjiS (DUF1127 family)
MADMTYSFHTHLPLPAFLTRVSGIASSWQRRARQRAELAQLSDVELHDLPVSRVEADFEMRKPFWRD